MQFDLDLLFCAQEQTKTRQFIEKNREFGLYGVEFSKL